MLQTHGVAQVGGSNHLSITFSYFLSYTRLLTSFHALLIAVTPELIVIFDSMRGQFLKSNNYLFLN